MRDVDLRGPVLAQRHGDVLRRGVEPDEEHPLAAKLLLVAVEVHGVQRRACELVYAGELGGLGRVERCAGDVSKARAAFFFFFNCSFFPQLQSGTLRAYFGDE